MRQAGAGVGAQDAVKTRSAMARRSLEPAKRWALPQALSSSSAGVRAAAIWSSTSMAAASRRARRHAGLRIAISTSTSPSSEPPHTSERTLGTPKAYSGR